MNKTTWTVATGLLLCGAAVGVLAGRALATGAPVQTPLTYGGTITDKDGKPYASVQDVSLAFYDKADATVPKCTAPLTQAEAGTGRFSVVLPAECAQAVHDAPDLWTEATVGAGKTVLPRTHVGAVPYALEADSAKVANGAGGGLKATLDGVVADVAGLKGAPAGGGPWVVDSTGVKLGGLLALSPDGSKFSVATGNGYVIEVRPNGDYFAMGLFWSGPNCTANPTLFAAYCCDKAQTTNRRAVFNSLKQGFYVPNGPANGFTQAGAFSANATDNAGLCSNSAQTSGLAGWQMKSITLTELGLPASITGPLTIQP
jgi:hypothetical protein